MIVFGLHVLPLKIVITSNMKSQTPISYQVEAKTPYPFSNQSLFEITETQNCMIKSTQHSRTNYKTDRDLNFQAFTIITITLFRNKPRNPRQKKAKMPKNKKKISCK